MYNYKLTIYLVKPSSNTKILKSLLNNSIKFVIDLQP